MMRNIIIVDIDGTVANLEHRLHHIKKELPDWDAFHAEVSGDSPIREVMLLIEALNHMKKYQIVLVTGRMERCRKDTETWLRIRGLSYDRLMMRKEKDFRPDYEIKQDILFMLGTENVLLAIDDRDQVVKMWRSHGIRTLQVADGAY